MESEGPKPFFSVDFRALVAKILWYVLGALFIYSSVCTFFWVKSISQSKQWEKKYAESKTEMDRARADADRARKERAPIILQIQTNMVILAQSVSNVSRIESAYADATNSFGALAIYRSRHPVH